jgi:hypothetical protein
LRVMCCYDRCCDLPAKDSISRGSDRPQMLPPTLLTPLSLILFVSLCLLPGYILLGGYTLFLEVAAIKAVHRFGWDGSAAALLMPTILIGMLCGIAFLGLLRIAGPSISDIFQQLQQTQPGIK